MLYYVYKCRMLLTWKTKYGLGSNYDYKKRMNIINYDTLLLRLKHLRKR